MSELKWAGEVEGYISPSRIFNNLGWNEGLKKIPPRTLQNATKKGRIVHNLIDAYFQRGDPVNHFEYDGYCQAFRDFESEHELVTFKTEYQIWSHAMETKGVIDWVGMFDGQLYILDWKTSTKLDDRKNMIQLSAYAMMYEYWTNDRPKIAVIQLKKNGKYVIRRYRVRPKVVRECIGLASFMVEPTENLLEV